MNKTTTDHILRTIDKTHALAQEAMSQKNLSQYMSVFANELSYKALNKKVITKQQLTKDTKKYFSRILSFKNNYKRINYTIEYNKLFETLIQKAKICIRVFFFFKKNMDYNSKRNLHMDTSRLEN
ncbi:hypothetical protein [Aquimarina longa]|uniref:hypothetical protein n=1 Tax=Aquimarina longa TaxID=1080221 RepID=UPI000782798F|nr:hypothetical protein [Aquimarina longa]